MTNGQFVMGVTERKEREKALRLNAILDAAADVFREKGFHSATMNDVAEKAELAKGTLYLYYKNKEDLTAGLTARGMEILGEKFRKINRSKKRGIEKIRSFGEAYFDFSNKFPLYSELLINFSSRGFENEQDLPNVVCCQESGQATLGLFIDAISEGISDGSVNRSVDPVKTALLLWSSSHGIIMLIKNQGELVENVLGIKRKTFTGYFFDFMENAIKK